MAHCNRVIMLCCLVLATSLTQAKVVTVATSEGPPYMIRQGDTGLDLDITRAALKVAGHTMRVEYMSLTQTLLSLLTGQVDATMPIFSNDNQRIYFSKPHVYYTPAAHSLISQDVEINNIHDLRLYRVASFKGATKYFGAAYAEAVNHAPYYYEYADMTELVKALLNKRYEAIVLDYNIFHYFLRQLQPSAELRAAVHFHDIIPKVTASVAFSTPLLRDQFNEGLSTIKHNGVYQRILKKYISMGINENHPIPE